MSTHSTTTSVSTTTTTTPPSTPPVSSSSNQLLLDAQDMEQALQVLTRPGARDKLESYVHTLEHEAAAKQRQEEQPKLSYEEWQNCCDYVTEGAWF